MGPCTGCSLIKQLRRNNRSQCESCWTRARMSIGVCEGCNRSVRYVNKKFRFCRKCYNLRYLTTGVCVKCGSADVVSGRKRPICVTCNGSRKTTVGVCAVCKETKKLKNRKQTICGTCYGRINKCGAGAALAASLNGDCPICRIRRATSVDHCHVTNIARGKLCSNCNAGLGYFGDDTERLGRAIEYLKTPQIPASRVLQ